jgi:hypothetical protein
MFGRQVAWILVPAVLAFSSVALAADPAPSPAATSEQVKELQSQIEQMRKELAEMKKLVETGDMPAQQRHMMMGHMGRMEGHMHGMMNETCTMDPGSCPGHMR